MRERSRRLDGHLYRGDELFDPYPDEFSAENDEMKEDCRRGFGPSPEQTLSLVRKHRTDKAHC